MSSKTTIKSTGKANDTYITIFVNINIIESVYGVKLCKLDD